MADNMLARDATGATLSLRSKDLGSGLHLPFKALAHADGVPVSSSNRLPVDAGLGAAGDAPPALAANAAGALGWLRAVVDRLTGVLSVAVPATAPYGSGTRAYAGVSRLAVGAASAAAEIPALGASREILLHANARCFVTTGIATAVAAAGTSIPLEPGEKFHLRVPAGHTHLAVIQDGVPGFITVAAVA